MSTKGRGTQPQPETTTRNQMLILQMTRKSTAILCHGDKNKHQLTKQKVTEKLILSIDCHLILAAGIC